MITKRGQKFHTDLILTLSDAEKGRWIQQYSKIISEEYPIFIRQLTLARLNKRLKSN